jgi:CBS-domain-containing membrane protein
VRGPGAVNKIVSMPSRPLPLNPLQTKLSVPYGGAWRVGLEDPARSVMTDFHERGMVTVPFTLQVDEALEVMKHAGVRSAFVVDEDRTSILGLVTAFDIMGEKPLRHLRLVGCAREEVLVSDIMDRAGGWDVARIEDVDRANVAALIETLARMGRTHLAVVEDDPVAARGTRLRGLFSSAKLLRLTEEARRVAKAQKS